jgi:hypothetical protein
MYCVIVITWAFDHFSFPFLIPINPLSNSLRVLQVAEHQVQTLGALLGSKGPSSGGNAAVNDGEIEKLQEKIALLEVQLRNRDTELEVCLLSLQNAFTPPHTGVIFSNKPRRLPHCVLPGSAR